MAARVRDRQVNARTVAVRAKPRFITIQLVKHLMEEVMDPREDEFRGRTAAKAARLMRKRVDFLVDTLCTLAMNGDTTAIKMIMDRVEGSATQTVAFKMADLEEQTQTPQDLDRIRATHAKLSLMTTDELQSLYHATISSASLSASSGTSGSA